MSKDDDNNVGYKKPPKSKQFQKGKSGNPAGRPKGRKSFRALFFEHMHGDQKIFEDGEWKMESRIEVLFRALFQNAIKGDLNQMRMFLDLAEEAERSYVSSRTDPLFGIGDPLISAFEEERELDPRHARLGPDYKFDLAQEIAAEARRQGSPKADILRKTVQITKDEMKYINELRKIKLEKAKKNRPDLDNSSLKDY